MPGLVGDGHILDCTERERHQPSICASRELLACGDALNLLGRLRRRILRGLGGPPVRDAERRIGMDGSTSEGVRHATRDQASPWERTQEPG
jgi:hypothetical protein